MSQEPETLVKMSHLRLKFGEKTILKDVNLTVPRGEILVVMGLSGGGKSTILSLLLGLLEASGGSIFFRNEDLTKLPRHKLNQARGHIGMVYQNAALISSMNVHDNLALPLQELSDKEPEEIDRLIDEKLKMVGLEDVKQKLPSELSGGMQKRVGLARALMLEPELVLFDEPSAGLDPINTKLIDDLIIDLRQNRGATSIVVTHEMDSAFAIATRMAFLHQGEIILEGTPEGFRQSRDPRLIEFLATYSAHADATEKARE